MQHTANRFSSLAADETEDFMAFYTTESVYFYDVTLCIIAATEWQCFHQLCTFSFLASAGEVFSWGLIAIRLIAPCLGFHKPEAVQG